jgi:hypothetical protein
MVDMLNSLRTRWENALRGLIGRSSLNPEEQLQDAAMAARAPAEPHRRRSGRAALLHRHRRRGWKNSAWLINALIASARNGLEIR